MLNLICPRSPPPPLVWTESTLVYIFLTASLMTQRFLFSLSEADSPEVPSIARLSLHLKYEYFFPNQLPLPLSIKNQLRAKMIKTYLYEFCNTAGRSDSASIGLLILFSFRLQCVGRIYYRASTCHHQTSRHPYLHKHRCCFLVD